MKHDTNISIINQSIWRGTPGDEADVPATELPFTYRISTLSFPLHSCRSRYNVSRIFLKGLFLHLRATALERERGWLNSVRKRQLCSGDVGFVTWRSSSYVCHVLFADPTTLQYFNLLQNMLGVSKTFSFILQRSCWKSLQFYLNSSQPTATNF